jgi:adenylate cyclase
VPRWPLGFAVVGSGPDEVTVPIHDMLVIGRELDGIDEAHRMIITDETASRRHAEIRLDPSTDRAFIFDTSTNGTRLNGTRIDSSTNVRLRAGDLITIGQTVIEFRSDRFAETVETPAFDSHMTTRAVSVNRLAMVAGDVMGYEAITQYTDGDAVLKDIDQLYGALLTLLGRHGGTLNTYVADAFFGTWDADQDPTSVACSLAFAMEARELVTSLAPTLALRTPDDDPIQMGWGLTVGTAAMSALAGSRLAVLGDATNIAFQLSTIAGREGRPHVVVTSAVEEVLRDQYEFTEPEEVMFKGRLGAERIFGVRRHLSA